MPTDDGQQNERLAELQKAALAALRQQQEAFLAGVKAWREALANRGPGAPAWPDFKPPDFVPKPTELGNAMTAPNKKT